MCYRRNQNYEGETDCMEHKGGRIKDHIKREETQEKEDWLDVEWLDDEEDTPGRGDAMQTPSGSDEEPFEIEDWRDEENWNLDRKEESPKEEPAQNADQKPAGDRSGAGASRGGSAKSSQARQSGAGSEYAEKEAAAAGTEQRKRWQKAGEKAVSVPADREAFRRPQETGAKGSGQTKAEAVRICGPSGKGGRTCSRKSWKDGGKSGRKGIVHRTEMRMFCHDGSHRSGVVA